MSNIATLPDVPPRLRLTGTMIVAIAILGGWFVALTADFIAPYDPDAIDIVNMLGAPNAEHWFGTDQVGRDVFSRVLHASESICFSALLASCRRY